MRRNKLKHIVGLLVMMLGHASIGVGAPSIENVAELTAPKVVTLPSDQGPVEASIIERAFTIRVGSKGGVDHVGRFVAVPSKKIYWLGYSSGKSNTPLTERQFFVLGGTIVAVSTSMGDHVLFFVSSEPLGSDVTQSARDAFAQRFSNLSTRGFDVERYSIRMEDFLGLFPFKQMGGMGEPAPKITNIAVNSDGFTLTFRGGTKDNIEATITFGYNFQPVVATLQGKQVFPKTDNSVPVIGR